jgi:hypothetical protein
MNQSVKYRQNAAECYEAARILSDPRQNAKLLAMAHSWISLADHADRDSHFEAATDPLPKGERRVVPPPRRAAPASHQLFIISRRATFRRSFDEKPSPTSLVL